MAIQWYPRYPGDYSRDTRSLSLAEHGAYTLLLDELYVTGKPLPSDLMQLHRICNAHGAAEQAAVAKVISRFFVKSGTGWVQLRAMAEIQKQESISKKRRAAALKSHGLELPLEPPDAPASDVQLQTHPHLTSTSLTTTPTTIELEPPGAARRQDVVWDAVIQVCGLANTVPTKTQRGSWNRAVKELKEIGATPEAIKARGEALTRQWEGRIQLTPMALVKNWSSGNGTGSGPGGISKVAGGHSAPDRVRGAGAARRERSGGGRT